MSSSHAILSFTLYITDTCTMLHNVFFTFKHLSATMNINFPCVIFSKIQHGEIFFLSLRKWITGCVKFEKATCLHWSVDRWNWSVASPRGHQRTITCIILIFLSNWGLRTNGFLCLNKVLHYITLHVICGISVQMDVQMPVHLCEGN